MPIPKFYIKKFVLLTLLSFACVAIGGQASRGDEPRRSSAAVSGVAGMDHKGKKLFGGELQTEIVVDESTKEGISLISFNGGIGATNDKLTGHLSLTHVDSDRRANAWKNEIGVIDAQTKTVRYIQVQSGPSFPFAHGDLHFLLQPIGLVHQRDFNTTGLNSTISITTEQKLLEALKLHAEVEAGLAYLHFREKSEKETALNVSSPGALLNGKLKLVYRVGQNTSVALQARAQQVGGKVIEVMPHSTTRGSVTESLTTEEQERDISSFEFTGGISVHQAF